MIAYIKGELIEKEPAVAILEANGIGYFLKISLNTYTKLPEKGSVQLFTHFMVREDAQTLYGFYTREELYLFEELISVSGVGGNTALTMLSSISPEELREVIESENVAQLKRVKGIGAKTAGRIILELKGKLKIEGTVSEKTATGVRQEAIDALTSLGFPKASMEKKVDALLRKHAGTISVEELIKLALQNAS